jgi:hypothetical protein
MAVIIPLLIISVLAGVAIAVFVWRQIASESKTGKQQGDTGHRKREQGADESVRKVQ